MSATAIRGLWLSPNDSRAPKGSLSRAENIWFDRPGIAEPRPGLDWLLQSASVGGTINAGIVFRGSTIVHYGTASVARWTGTAWSTYSGTFNPPDSSTKPHFFEAENSLFLLTSAGVYELDNPTTGTWRLTGAPVALQGTATLRRTTSESGNFTSPNGQWAYRYVWAIENANRRLQLGAPSGRFILTVPANVVATAANIDKPSAGQPIVRVVNTTHGFTTGEYIDVTLGGAEANYVAGRFQVTVTSSSSFTYNDGGANGVVGNPGANITYGFTARDADLVAPIPSGITTAHVLQVYRSPKSADANTDPSDNMGQVAERAPTNLEIAAGTMTIKDIAPDGLRSPTLYTSLSTLTASKLQPPAAHDACLFAECGIYANVAGFQGLDLQFLAVGTPLAIQAGDLIIFQDRPDAPNLNTWVVVLTVGTTEDLPNGQFQLFTTGSVAQNIAETTKSLVRAVNGHTTNTKLYADYVSADTEPPGRVRIRGRSPTVEQFCVRVFHSITSTATAPGRTVNPALSTSSTIQDMARAGSTVTVNLNMAHGYAVGQQVELSHSTNTTLWPNGIKTVASTPSGTQFTYTEAGTASGAVANGGEFTDQALTIVQSWNTSVTSALMWSPPGEPWAVPAINFKDLGKGTIYRCIPTRDKVLLETDAGFFQMRGDGSSWAFDEFDTTLEVRAYRTGIAGGGRAYALTDQGFVEMLDSARIVSTPIEKALRDLLATAPDSVAARAFAVADDAQRKVYLFLPDDNADTASTQVYVYHTDSGDWTGPWALTDVANMHAGWMGANDTLSIASGGYVMQQRKTRSGVADQVDPVLPASVTGTITKPGTHVIHFDTPPNDRYFFVGARVHNVTQNLTTTVSSYDSTTKNITLASAAAWVAGNTCEPVDTPIAVTMESVDLDNGDPGSQKLFQEGGLEFDDTRFASAGLAFWSDLVGSTYSDPMTLAPPGGSSTQHQTIDFWVARGWMRAARLRWRFTHSTALERFAFTGYTLTGVKVSSGTTR